MVPLAVTFDFWNTLFVSSPGGVEVRQKFWESVVKDRKLNISSHLLLSVLSMLPERFESEWEAGRQYTAKEAMKEAFAVFGSRITSSDQEALSEAFDRASSELVVDLVVGAPEVLAKLASKGVALGLVSDTSLSAGRHLRKYLKSFGLLEYFGALAFSDEVGVYKPDSKIFLAALTKLGIDDPSKAVHVGDLRRTDVMGARTLGMTTIRFQGVVSDQGDYPEADEVIDNLLDLPRVIGFN